MTEEPRLSSNGASPLRRRLVPLAAIGVVALGILAWSWWTAPEDEEVRAAVEATMSEIAAAPEAEHPILIGALGEIPGLRDGLLAAEAGDVRIAAGDRPAPYGTGEATHLAVVHRDGTPVLGLRLVYERRGGPLRIIGHWDPELATAPSP